MKSYESAAALILVLLSPVYGLGIPTPISTPSPLHQPVHPDCSQFYQAKAGDDCESISDANSISSLDFVWFNGGLDHLHSCDEEEIKPGTWYCVEVGDMSSAVSTVTAVEPKATIEKRKMVISIPVPSYIIALRSSTTLRPRWVASKTGGTPPAKPTGYLPGTFGTAGFHTRTSTAPRITVPPEPACLPDECAAGFQAAVGTAAASQSQFCARVLGTECRPYELRGMGLPLSLYSVCTQRDVCQDVSSACSCWTNGQMTWHPTRGQSWGRKYLNMKVPANLIH
ncbi:putative class V chitinase [Colletotrichum karsti]|uniref:Class V chitinase n=1 Tax=Colletotrichum karsti TaxID=1095194 RepID=A0A9P6ICG0_9PEZI|nr:putative class V chitinase [Colletotrichum karsti]KAF9876070.1 putative class V chitinase [Colletotrichum karsti]